MRLQQHERFREEDPYTDYMIDLPASRVVVETSRFQVDLNRRREDAVYRKPEDAWGLTVWNSVLLNEVVAHILEEYDRFYADMDKLLQSTLAEFGKFIVLDVHTYNHRRQHPDHPTAADENPEINIGTRHNHKKWKPLGNSLCSFLAHHRFLGRFLDVRENVKFGGGGFAEWINHRYGNYGCVFSIEFKKIFMDEWTGWVNIAHLQYIQSLLGGCVPFLMHMLDMPVKRTLSNGR